VEADQQFRSDADRQHRDRNRRLDCDRHLIMLTVTDPADTHRLTTLAMIKGELQLSGGADDAVLTAFIDQASAAARSWCRRTFAEETVSETVYLDRPASPIELSRYPVTEIASVTVAGTVLDPTEYEVEDDTGWLYRLDASGGRCARFCGRVVIEYTGGYILPDAPQPTLPDDISRAAALLVKGAYFARTRDPAIRSESVEGAGSFGYFSGTTGDLPPEVEGLLRQYRAPRIG
jgi:uncharacterized phiE125 gp8 family phage protein